MTRLRLINCARENDRAEQMATINAGIAQREGEPWDWADYAALRLLAARRYVSAEDTEPVVWALERCEFALEDEQWRRIAADELRKLTRER